MDSIDQIFSFYGWWQFAVCLFAFVALFAIWWHIGKLQGDFGLVWLALSVLCWSISGIVDVYFVTRLEGRALMADGWRSIFSLLNSLFILLALPWFRFIPQKIEHVIKSKYWIYIIGLPFLFSILPTLNKMIFGKQLGLISELDVYYSLMTLVFLGLVLWGSFAKRRLQLLAWLSLITILVTLIAQLYKLTDEMVNLTLFSAIFKTALIMLFFALALSWVKELAENIIPSAHLLFIQFKEEKTGNKLDRYVVIKGLPGTTERKIKLTNASYDLFYKFAKRKIEEDKGWLEIKPKNYQLNKTYDINDHNEIKRLLSSLLDGIFGKDNWTRSQHYEPLKASLFELSQERKRKIRLLVPAENLSL